MVYDKNMQFKKNSDDFNTLTFKAKIKDIIEDSMIYSSFIEATNIKTIKDGDIYLVFQTKNDLKFMMKNYKDEIEKAFHHVFGIHSKYEAISHDDFKKIIDQIGTLSVSNSNLNKRYQLSKYIEGKFNTKLISLGKKIMLQEKTFYNPIFIHSHSGLGKTHFLHGIGNELIKKDKNVCYINPDQFIKKVTQYLMQSNQDKLSEIIDYYKNFDVLLFDDIQQYGSKPATLNVLFNILNYHIENESQIIIASDKTPDLLGGFEERFITRFQGGITEAITTPSLDDFMIIFKEKLKQSNLDPKDWENEAIKFIIRNHSNSIRTLEGAINKIEWNNQNNHQHIKYTYQVVTEMFSYITKENENATPERIVEIVAKYYNISKVDVLGKSRRKDIVLARHISMWLIRNIINKTYKEIGIFFKGKDHSTVMTSIEKIDYQMKVNETVKNTLKILKGRINQG